MSSAPTEQIANRLTRERLSSYLSDCDQNLERSLALYDWNLTVAAALHADLGRFEIVFRNALDQSLCLLASSRGWPDSWEHHSELFVGKAASRTRADIAKARTRATRGRRQELHGKVVAELNFGFWRYLCTKPHLTTLWVPALARAFPDHPTSKDARRVRSDVDVRVQRLLYLRNRIAHHEPIHRRNLERDCDNIITVAGWISADCGEWIRDSSRVPEALRQRPT